MEDALADQFWAGQDVEELVRERATFIDAFLCELWHHWFEYDDDCALFAVGGYGRGELHPKSDIDLLILIKERLRNSERIGEFIRLLWDLKLEIGHSVRTVRECKSEATRDLSVMTALIERRLLIGSPRLAQKLDRALSSRFLWPSNRFFSGKLEEQNARHEHYSDIEYGLEPNIKSSPGGLRDIQTISWITQKHCETTDLSELIQRGFLTESECKTLLDGRRFLWQVRFALHLLTRRKEDQLYFDHQREIADRFGYKDSDGLLAVEAFMRDYYRLVLELREVNDILIQHFTEATPSRRRRVVVEPINGNFRIRNHYIETTASDVFRRQPSALMEIFVIMANRTDIRGVRANTIRQIRQSLELIDDRFRHDKEIGKLFVTLLKSPYTVVSQLTRMRRYGILGAYIPEFGRVIGQMQHDLFHIYTVDAHTMTLLRNLRRMYLPEYEDLFPFLRGVVAKIHRIELLFIAGLFHDIGKGRGGNHSSLGAVDAGKFCDQVGIDEDGRDLVVWLVQRHLYMSMTSQREDLSDPANIHKFATIVQSTERLHYLMALTAADIHATNPKEWNAWRESLLIQLYNSTLAVLEQGGYGTNERVQAVEKRQQETAVLLEQRAIKHVDLDFLWTDVSPGFVLSHEAPTLADIAVAIVNRPADSQGIVQLFEATGERLYTIFIYTRDRPRLFADCVAVLDVLNLDVMRANISTGASDFCYDSFVVMEDEANLVPNTRKSEIQDTLQRVIDGNPAPERRQHRRISRQLKQFDRPARVTINEPNANGISRLEVVTADRPGLLALISSLFVEFNIELHQARITTLGERVEDIFLVSTTDDTSLVNPAHVDALKSRLTDRINAELPQLTY
ncbi:MAG: [protein-PII] uridylyltransferase [Gammaproteobacteria bacterium]|nr:[protein-PII] uridylyltransferase [Gammaproteobacteria bacterium]